MLNFNKKFLPMLEGDGGGGGGGNPEPEKETKTFTQDEVNSIASREKKQGRSSLLKELGYEDEKTLKDVLTAHKAAEEKNKSDLDKARDLADKAEREKKDAESKSLATERAFMAVEAGAPAKNARDIVVLAMQKMDDNTPFEKALEQVKAAYPSMFEANTSDTGHGGTPPRTKDTSGKGGIGKRLAEKRASETIKEQPFFK